MAKVESLDDVRAAMSAKAASKVSALIVAREGIQQANAFWNNASENSDTATSIVSKAIVPLILSRVSHEAGNSGTSAKEVSSLLIDIFGAVPKKDGKPGSTPLGKGQEIRKRIVRMVEAAPLYRAYLEGREVLDTDRPVWAVGADLEGVAAIYLSAVTPKEEAFIENGEEVIQIVGYETPVYTAYDKFAECKVKADPVHNAFKPEYIVKMADELLSNPDGLRNEVLVKAYLTLEDAVRKVNAFLIEMDEEQAEAA